MPWTPTEGESKATAIVKELHNVYQSYGWDLCAYRAVELIAGTIDNALKTTRQASTNGAYSAHWDNPNWIQAASEAGILKPGTPDGPALTFPDIPTADPAGYAETSEIAKVVAELPYSEGDAAKTVLAGAAAYDEKAKRTRGRPKGAKNKKAKSKAKPVDVGKAFGTHDSGP